MQPNQFTRLSGLRLATVLLLAGHPAWSQTAFYIPKSLITPVHTHKGGLHVSLGWGGGYDANVSYAFSDHFAAFVTGTLKRQTEARVSFIGPSTHDITHNDYVLKGGRRLFQAPPQPGCAFARIVRWPGVLPGKQLHVQPGAS